MSDWIQLLEGARQLSQRGRTAEALQECDRAAQQNEEARYSAALTRGEILLDLGDAVGALSSYDSVADPFSPDSILDCARGLALFELGLLPEAEAALTAAIQGDSDLAEAFYTLGLIHELTGIGDEAVYFRQARQKQPELYPPDQRYSRQEFERIINEAVSDLPEEISVILEQYPVIVADLPMVDELKQVQPQISPRSLALVLGVEPQNSIGDRDPCLLIFKRNIERAFRDRAEIVQNMRSTVIQEFIDALGLSYEDFDAF